MSFNQKPSETGWFYHAPKKLVQPVEPVAAPPASQIPGLNDLPDQPEQESTKMWIRETDSDYIKMAKMGGRADLLRYRDPKPRSEEPMGYPRCDWYYHDDVQATNTDDRPNNQNYEFLLPDYMVHPSSAVEQHKPSDQPKVTFKEKPKQHGNGDSKRAPYAFDQQTVFDREGHGATDKTVKLPELRRGGYGVRAEKQENQNPKYSPIQRTEPVKPPSPTVGPSRPKYQPMPQKPPTEENRAVMQKLLSHGYVQDWEQDREKWFAKCKIDDGQSVPGKNQSEYQSNMGQNTSAKKRPTQASANSKSQKDKNETEKEKELFKLSRFKHVPARTDNHWSKGSAPPHEPNGNGNESDEDNLDKRNPLIPGMNGEIPPASRGRRPSDQSYRDNNPILYSAGGPPSAGGRRGSQRGASPPLTAQEEELYRQAHAHGERVRAQRQTTNPIIS